MQTTDKNQFSQGICLAIDSATEVLALACGHIKQDGTLEILAEANAPANRRANVELLCRIDKMLKSVPIQNIAQDNNGEHHGSAAPQKGDGEPLTEDGHLAEDDCLAEGDHLKISDIDAIVVGRGPGSFTGVRIGVAAAKGLACAIGCPLFGVSTLDAIAHKAYASGITSKIAVIDDAMRKEVYPSLYTLKKPDEHLVCRLEPYTVEKPEDTIKRLAQEKKSLLCMGNGLIKYRDIFEEAGYTCADEELWAPTGSGLLYAFAQALKTGEQGSGDAATLLPIYTRLSDAEENERAALKEKAGKIPESGVADYNSGVANYSTNDKNDLKTEFSSNTKSTKPHPLILSIESSCDETAAAILDGNRQVCSSVIASQINFHARFGGVVPEIASRKHIEAIVAVVEKALEQANICYKDLDAIAVTQGPGLVGCLVVGLAFAKSLGFALDLPIIGVNHLEGHLYANLFVDPKIKPPFVALLVSGGHTMLVHVKKWGSYETLGSTLDDAVGEAFDKVAKALKLGYPGGPILSQLAKEGNSKAIHFPRAMLHSGDLSFSLSGLKTSVITYIKKQNDAGIKINLPDLAASFQAAVIDVQVSKALNACNQVDTHLLCLGGGVAANDALREALKTELGKHNIRVLYPKLADCGDNAAMIGAAACDLYKKQQFISLDADPIARMPLD